MIMNETMDWKITPQHVIDIMEEVNKAKKLKDEQILLQSTPTNRISIKEWAEKFRILEPINCPGWSNLTDTGELLEQSSTTQQQPESSEIMGTDLSGGPDFTAIWELRQCFARSGEDARLSKELQELTQEIPNEKSSSTRANELLHTFIKQKKYGSRINSKKIKLQNHRYKSNFTKCGHS